MNELVIKSQVLHHVTHSLGGLLDTLDVLIDTLTGGEWHGEQFTPMTEEAEGLMRTFAVLSTDRSILRSIGREVRTEIEKLNAEVLTPEETNDTEDRSI